MQVYIHIGTHKTGTTSIQSVLRNYSQQLKKAGIYVPRAATFGQASGHHNLAFELIGDSRFDPSRGGLEELLQELSNHNSSHAVVSAEDLEYLVDQPESLARLEEAMISSGHEVSYLMFVRRVDHYAESLYSTLLGCRVRPRMGFIGYALRILLTGKYQISKPGRNWTYIFDYPRFARRWRSIANSPLSIYSFDQAAETGGIISSFLSLIQAPEDLIEEAKSYPALNSRSSQAKEVLNTSRHRRAIRKLLRWRFIGNDVRMSSYAKSLAPTTSKIVT